MKTNEDFEGEPFIGGIDTSNHEGRRRRACRISLAIIGHVSVLLTYTTIFVYLYVVHVPTVETSLHPIERLRIKLMPKPYDDYIVSPYAGVPSPKLDKAWHDLLSPTTIRVSESELHKSNQSSVELPDGGYMAWLGVFHELHCIKMLRQWNYREHYHPNISDDEAVHLLIHADHCLDVLRSAAVCHGDTTLSTFGWADNPTKPMLNTRQIDHKCVDWEFLSESVADRVVSEEEMSLMVNPNL